MVPIQPRIVWRNEGNDDDGGRGAFEEAIYCFKNLLDSLELGPKCCLVYWLDIKRRTDGIERLISEDMGGHRIFKFLRGRVCGVPAFAAGRTFSRVERGKVRQRYF